MLRKIFLMLPLELRIKIKSKYRLGYFVNSKKPRTFNEKINYRKLNWKNPLIIKCADKIQARDYVANMIGSNYLIPCEVLGNKVGLDQLKEKLKKEESIVIKANHNSGPVFFLNEKDTDEKILNIINQLHTQLETDYGYISGETWYSKIEPLVYFEKALIDKNGLPPNDFKFHVFKSGSSNKVFVQVDYDRFSDHGRQLYDENFRKLNFSLQYPDKSKKINKPKNFEEMKQIAIKLGENFSYSRIDLYEFENKIYFGEVTFANDGGFGRFSEYKYDMEWGSYWVEINN